MNIQVGANVCRVATSYIKQVCGSPSVIAREGVVPLMVPILLTSTTEVPNTKSTVF